MSDELKQTAGFKRLEDMGLDPLPEEEPELGQEKEPVAESGAEWLGTDILNEVSDDQDRLIFLGMYLDDDRCLPVTEMLDSPDWREEIYDLWRQGELYLFEQTGAGEVYEPIGTTTPERPKQKRYSSTWESWDIQSYSNLSYPGGNWGDEAACCVRNG